MKYTWAITLLMIITGNSCARSSHILNCDSFCVQGIVYDTANGHALYVTIENNDSNFINYPIVQLINTNLDTVANQQKSFDFYGQNPHSVQIYHIPTILDSFPSGWAGQVRLEDGLFHNACIINFPCANLSEGVTNVKSTFSCRLFPNPGQSDITVEASFSGTIEFFDLQGQIVQKGNFGTGNTNLNIRSLPCSIYLMEIKNNLAQTVKRIKWVKQ